MRISTVALFLLMFFSCKKENLSPAQDHEVTTVTAQQTKDTVETATVDSLIDTSQIVEVYTYHDELCEYRGIYNPAKVSKAQLENAFALWQNKYTSLPSPGIYYLEALPKFRRETDTYLQNIQQQYNEQKNILIKMDLPPTAFWQNVRKTDLRTLEDVYSYYATEAKAFSDPAELKKSRFSKACQKYVTALNSDEQTLRKAWENHIEFQASRNGDPEKVRSDFRIESASSEFRDYAMIDLITFGWGNCVNDQIPRVERNEKMYREFENLFEKTETVDCDEP